MLNSNANPSPHGRDPERTRKHFPKTRDIILISDILPAPTFAASLTMHRHLIERGGFRVTTVNCSESESSLLSRNVSRRIKNSRFHRFFVDIEFLLNRWNRDAKMDIPSSVGDGPCVFTLAHGNGCWVAKRFAQEHALPLVVRFDDWWPDMIQAHDIVRARVQRAYRDLYDAADCAICISEGMREALGSHPNARVIVPIPRVAPEPAPKIPFELPLRVCYLGNLYEYGPMLADLVNAAEAESNIRIEFRGGEPRWSTELIARLKSDGRLHQFEDGSEFTEWFESFHVYLVAMFFASEQRRRVETCFATKLTEYTSLGRPIVIWAPESSAIVKWARKTKAAVCVTSPDPMAVVDALRKLSTDTARLAELSQLSRIAYETDFCPDNLHKEFVAAIDSVLD